jgi:pimeloyl-ACP methyl ester carboxylesterase
MMEDRMHRVASADGTELAVRVRGNGPPVIFLPAGPGDSETTCRRLVAYVDEHFTCGLLDTRTKPWFDDSVRDIATHVRDPRIREIAEAGHFGPRTAPRAVADALIQFLSPATNRDA